MLVRGSQTPKALIQARFSRASRSSSQSLGNVRSGKEIFGEGEDAQFVYKLVMGNVRVCKMLSDGQRHISCFHVPGDVFGLERTATHRMSAEAIEDSQVLMFRRSQVERLIASEVSAAHQMLGILLDKLDHAEARIFRLGRQTALQRVAAFSSGNGGPARATRLNRTADDAPRH